MNKLYPSDVAALHDQIDLLREQLIATTKERNDWREQAISVDHAWSTSPELAATEANAARYELMRDMALYAMQVNGTMPVSIEESHDWFDAQIDAKIREQYPNATIGEVK